MFFPFSGKFLLSVIYKKKNKTCKRYVLRTFFFVLCDSHSVFDVLLFAERERERERRSLSFSRTTRACV